jgi:hypothetical protein
VETPAAGEGGLVILVSQGGHRGVAVVGGCAAGPASLPFDLEFQGEALWIGLEGDGRGEVRALGLRRLRSEALGLDLSEKQPAASGDWRLLESLAGAAGLSGRWERRGNG